MRQLTTASLSNQNISAALLVATYTADADRNVFFRVFLDQIAGSGDYTIYITIQRLGAGSAYKSQVTTETVAAGVTAVAFTTIPIPVKNTDVVKVYVLGLAGDTTTPDIVTEVWDDCLPSAAAGAASGLPVLDASGNLRAVDDNGNELATAAGQAVIAAYLDAEIAAILEDTGTTLPAAIAAVKTDTGNLVTRIPAALFSGITSLAQWLGLIAGKQTGNSTARTELRATGAGSGAYDETTDSLEAVRDRGDVAWISGTGATYITLDTVNVGEAPEVNFTAYQFAKMGTDPAWSFTASSTLTGKSLSLVAWKPGSATAAFTLTSAAGNIVVSGGTGVTVSGPDTNTQTPATYRYILRNTTDDTVVIVGTITVEAALNAS